MDIYIRTEDVRLGRALALEAQAAGFSAGFGQDAADARLTVCGGCVRRHLFFPQRGGLARCRSAKRRRRHAVFALSV